jgi:hypothetical protein
VVAWRIRDGARALNRLNLVLAVGLALALVSSSNILGYLWFYLVLWSWSITVLMVLATAWVIALVVARWAPDDLRPKLAALGWAAVAAVLVVAFVSFTLDSADAQSPDFQRSEMLRVLVPPTAKKLALPGAIGGGRDGRYLITWTDPVSIGAGGFGLVNALDARGFHVGVGPEFDSSMTHGRSFPRSDATGEIHLAVGDRAIAEWRAKPAARELAYASPKTKDLAEFQRLRSQAIASLQDAGLDNLVPVVDDSLFMVSFLPQVPVVAKDAIARMLEIGQPAAVFVEPTAGT